MSRITVTVEGGLLPDDLLERIADGSAPGQRAADFGLATGRLSDEIMRAFSDAQSYWAAFKHRHERASKSGRESVTTITRESFVIPLLEALAYKLEFKRSLTAGDQSFVISHTSGNEPTAPPVNIIGADDKLDERGSSRRSAHSSVQEYLNVSDCLWGLATNGNKLRLLRDSSRLAKPRYIEFDLEGMMESNVFSDFHLLYRLLHRSRLPHSSADASECWLEKYYQDGIDQGSRVRDRLRDGVVEALTLFGNAFLTHPKSEHVRKRIAAGELTAPAYYRELLRLVYRLLFLMVAEERRLMFPDSQQNELRRAVFSEHYGINRLRGRAERYIGDDPEIDLWESLKEAFLILRDDLAAHMLGMAALNGELFGPLGCPHLDGGGHPEQSAFCSNDELLQAIHSLSTFDDDGVRRRVNFAALDVEELGSVYESLLEYHPQLSPSPLSFDLVLGGERKSTGSYYTPPELVRELINSTLVPVMDDRLKLAKTKEDREKAILSMRVIDPAAGSGHFLLAAARKLGRELAKVRTGEEEPPPNEFRRAVRDAIRECIYAVDKNPLAVDLCKVALWIEGHNAGQPLSFLDHHVKCGDSLVGVFDVKVLEEGVPDDAYKAVEGDDKTAAKHYRKTNAETKKNPPSLPTFKHLPNQVIAALESLSHRDERTPEDVSTKEREYANLINNPAMQSLENACNAWTAAFFVPMRMPEFRGRDLVPTSSTVWERLSGRQIYGLLDGEIAKAKHAYSFFHWPVEFPEVFARGGFDVVLGNPPWERIKLQEKEYFAIRDPEIANAANKAARENLIKELPKRNPELRKDWAIAAHGAESQSKFVRESERFPLCGRGDVNTYSIFAELDRSLAGNIGRAGIIVPSGIATDDTTKFFFRDLIESRSLVSLYDFENRERIFPAVYYRVRFCLLTMAGKSVAAQAGTECVFFAKRVEDLRDVNKRVVLTPEDISLVNPNTLTCPVFISREDARIARDVYRRVPVLVKEGQPEENPYEIELSAMFHMSNDSHLFRTSEQLKNEGWSSVGNKFVNGSKDECLPLYEAKMIQPYNHRAASVVVSAERRFRKGQPNNSTAEELDDPYFFPNPHYYVEQSDINRAMPDWYGSGWLLGWRDITSITNERTIIACAIPRSAVVGEFSLIFSRLSPVLRLSLLASLNSFMLDFCARQKLGGTHLKFFTLRQLPMFSPDSFRAPTPWSTYQSTTDWIKSRVLELSYTSWDLRPLAQEVGYSGAPFRWDEKRRFVLRSELDAAMFHLYGLRHQDVQHVMNTFPTLKRRDNERFGEYRTESLILEIYDEMREAIRVGQTYQSRLEPLPGEPRAAHQGKEATAATPSQNP